MRLLGERGDCVLYPPEVVPCTGQVPGRGGPHSKATYAKMGIEGAVRRGAVKERKNKARLVKNEGIRLEEVLTVDRKIPRFVFGYR